MPTPSPSPSTPPHIAIIGGGLAGLTLSIGLTRHGVPHTLYESAASFAEVGAGIACGPNSILALTLIDSRIKACFEACATFDEGAECGENWLTFRYGMASSSTEEDGGGGPRPRFGDIITAPLAYSHARTIRGRSCFHRAKFLAELIKLIPSHVPQFSKTMTSLTQSSTSGVSISFADGTTATAAAAICCDGIKSLGRGIVLADSPEQIGPDFAGDFAYRVLLSRSDADAILGHAVAGNGNLFVGRGGYITMYPVEHGTLVNAVLVRRKDDMSWPHEDWLVPTPRETMYADWDGWGEPVQRILDKVKDTSRWALFDAPDAGTYVKGRVCLLGDAAHASTPHQGAGAGMAFEDAYVLSRLLGEVGKAEKGGGVEEVFRAYDEVRRPRTQKLVGTSRQVMGVYSMIDEEIGEDLRKIKRDVDERHKWIWEVDLPGEVERAKGLLGKESVKAAL